MRNEPQVERWPVMLRRLVPLLTAFLLATIYFGGAPVGTASSNCLSIESGASFARQERSNRSF